MNTNPTLQTKLYGLEKIFSEITNLANLKKLPSKVLLSGPKGSGKSTIINLILRFFDPNKGSIFIDNQDISQFSLSSLRQNISLVTQETTLFNDTIEANIKYSKLDASRKEVMKVAEEAGAIEFIEKLPLGFDTMIGERGQKLSVGQKQRIAIARALYKNPPILIFDEATSSVDNETELLLQKALNQISKNRTTIVIAHRLSTVRNADNIVVLGNNTIIESGNHGSHFF